MIENVWRYFYVEATLKEVLSVRRSVGLLTHDDQVENTHYTAVVCVDLSV